MKYTILLLLGAALFTGCDKHEGGTGTYSESTKETLENRKDAVDASARDAKKQAEADKDVEKARIEADKDKAKAQLDADKKKVEAEADVDKAKRDALDK
jgi:hypothetical protein